MAQLRAKQLRLTKPGDMIIGDSNSNGSILSIGTSEGQALVVKNTGTADNPVLGLAYDSVSGSYVSYDDTTTQLGAATVQDAIVKLKTTVGSLTGALVYTGTVDASIPTFTPSLQSTVQTGTYYQVSVAGNKIPTNSTNGSTPYETVQVGDAVVWNGTYWDVISHIDTIVTGTAGSVVVTGSPDEGYVVEIDPTYIGQSSITTVGTITSGVWNGSDLDLEHGGTNTDLSTTEDNSIIFKSGTGVQTTTPPSDAPTLAGSITAFTSNVSHTDPLNSDPNQTLTTMSGSTDGKDAVVTATTTQIAEYRISSLTVNAAGTGYATGDTVTITGFPSGSITIGSVDGNGGIQTLDFSNLQGSYSSTTDTSGTGIAQASTSGAGTGATFDVTETNTPQYTVTGFNITSTGSGYVVGDTITVKSTDGGSPVTLGTVNITGVATGSSGSETTYLSFDPSSKTFKWVDADAITGAAEQTIEYTDQFEFVSSDPGDNQTLAAANAVVTLTHLPVENSLTVFINGLRLGSSDFTYAVSTTDATKGTITLVDSSLGYSSEEGDIIEITYLYIAS